MAVKYKQVKPGTYPAGTIPEVYDDYLNTVEDAYDTLYHTPELTRIRNTKYNKDTWNELGETIDIHPIEIRSNRTMYDSNRSSINRQDNYTLLRDRTFVNIENIRSVYLWKDLIDGNTRTTTMSSTIDTSIRRLTNLVVDKWYSVYYNHPRLPILSPKVIGKNDGVIRHNWSHHAKSQLSGINTFEDNNMGRNTVSIVYPGYQFPLLYLSTLYIYYNNKYDTIQLWSRLNANPRYEQTNHNNDAGDQEGHYNSDIKTSEYVGPISNWYNGRNVLSKVPEPLNKTKRLFGEEHYSDLWRDIKIVKPSGHTVPFHFPKYPMLMSPYFYKNTTLGGFNNTSFKTIVNHLYLDADYKTNYYTEDKGDENEWYNNWGLNGRISSDYVERNLYNKYRNQYGSFSFKSYNFDRYNIFPASGVWEFDIASISPGNFSTEYNKVGSTYPEILLYNGSAYKPIGADTDKENRELRQNGKPILLNTDFSEATITKQGYSKATYKYSGGLAFKNGEIPKGDIRPVLFRDTELTYSISLGKYNKNITNNNVYTPNKKTYLVNSPYNFTGMTISSSILFYEHQVCPDTQRFSLTIKPDTNLFMDDSTNKWNWGDIVFNSGHSEITGLPLIENADINSAEGPLWKSNPKVKLPATLSPLYRDRDGYFGCIHESYDPIVSMINLPSNYVNDRTLHFYKMKENRFYDKLLLENNDWYSNGINITPSTRSISVGAFENIHYVKMSVCGNTVYIRPKDVLYPESVYPLEFLGHLPWPKYNWNDEYGNEHHRIAYHTSDFSKYLVERHGYDFTNGRIITEEDLEKYYPTLIPWIGKSSNGGFPSYHPFIVPINNGKINKGVVEGNVLLVLPIIGGEYIYNYYLINEGTNLNIFTSLLGDEYNWYTFNSSLGYPLFHSQVFLPKGVENRIRRHLYPLRAKDNKGNLMSYTNELSRINLLNPYTNDHEGTSYKGTLYSTIELCDLFLSPIRKLYWVKDKYCFRFPIKNIDDFDNLRFPNGLHWNDYLSKEFNTVIIRHPFIITLTGKQTLLYPKDYKTGGTIRTQMPIDLNALVESGELISKPVVSGLNELFGRDITEEELDSSVSTAFEYASGDKHYRIEDTIPNYRTTGINGDGILPFIYKGIGNFDKTMLDLYSNYNDLKYDNELGLWVKNEKKRNLRTGRLENRWISLNMVPSKYREPHYFTYLEVEEDDATGELAEISRPYNLHFIMNPRIRHYQGDVFCAIIHDWEANLNEVPTLNYFDEIDSFERNQYASRQRYTPHVVPILRFVNDKWEIIEYDTVFENTPLLKQVLRIFGNLGQDGIPMSLGTVVKSDVTFMSTYKVVNDISDNPVQGGDKLRYYYGDASSTTKFKGSDSTKRKYPEIDFVEGTHANLTEEENLKQYIESVRIRVPRYNNPELELNPYSNNKLLNGNNDRVHYEVTFAMLRKDDENNNYRMVTSNYQFNLEEPLVNTSFPNDYLISQLRDEPLEGEDMDGSYVVNDFAVVEKYLGSRPNNTRTNELGTLNLPWGKLENGKEMSRFVSLLYDRQELLKNHPEEKYNTNSYITKDIRFSLSNDIQYHRPVITSPDGVDYSNYIYHEDQHWIPNLLTIVDKLPEKGRQFVSKEVIENE